MQSVEYIWYNVCAKEGTFDDREANEKYNEETDGWRDAPCRRVVSRCLCLLWKGGGVRVEMKQTTDNELAVKCMNILMDAVGPVDAERFVSIVTNDSFDYTEWQQNLFKDETVESLFEKVRDFQPEQDFAR